LYLKNEVEMTHFNHRITSIMDINIEMMDVWKES
jgi:hypothetical protein